MRKHSPSKVVLHLVCAALLLLTAAAHAQDTVIQTSLLGRVESKRITVGSSIFVKVVSDWKDGRCRLRADDTLEARVVAIEHRTPASKHEKMAVRFLPLTCAGDESREIVPILVAIQSKPHMSDTSMLDRAWLMTAFSSMVGAEGMNGAAATAGQQNAGGRSMSGGPTGPPPLHTGEVRGFLGVTLTLPKFTVDPTAIQSPREILFDPEAQFFLVVRTIASHPSTVNIASTSPSPSAAGPSSIPVRLSQPVEVESCVESGCKLADLPALQTGGQLERRLSLRSLGYKPRGNRVLRSLGEDATVSFLGENQVLITFNAHALIERSPTDKAWDTAPRVIRALVVSVHDGKVLHAEDWRVNQEGEYLWPLEDGRVLVALGDTLTIFGPGLKLERQWPIPGPLATLRISPSHNLIVAAIVHERHAPEEHRRLADFMGPGRPVAEDYALTILDGKLNVIGTKQLNATPDIPAVLDSGLLVNDPRPRSQWKVSELQWNGKQHVIAEVHSPCPLRINSLPTNLILLAGCSADGMHSWYRVVRRDGKTLLNGATTGNGWLENAVALTAKRMFAVGIVEAGRRVDFEEGMYASEFQKISVSVYSSENGQRLYATPPLSGSPARQSFALNEDGNRLAVLSDGEISLYKTAMRSPKKTPAHPVAAARPSSDPNSPSRNSRSRAPTCYAGQFPMPTPDKPSPSPQPATLNTQLVSKLDPKAKRQQANATGMLALLSALRQQETAIREGGGSKAIDAQHAKQRLTARERIAILLDPGTELFELSAYAGFGMYEEWGGAPSAGVICGLGRVSGRLCMIVANDATVKAGAFFPMTAKKVLRAQHIAMENHLPTLYLVDSSGIFLPLQEDVFPDQDDFGRIFRNNARMSATGIPQITAIMGMCVAGGAYLPVMTDHVLMTEGSGLFLAGPALVEAAIGQKYSAEELGGATMHAEISGTVDFKEPNDHLCLARLRSLVAKLGHPARAPFDRAPFDAEKDAPKYPAQDLYSLIDPDPARASTNTYDMHELIARLVDRSEFDEYKPDYGRTVLCGYARIGGFAVGIVANQKQHQPHTSQSGEKRVEFGGVIYAESADKAARFILDCNQNLIPLIFIHDVNGFMVGRDAEWTGIIRSGAKMVAAVSNSTVPKITVIVGGSFGAGNYAMCGKAYDPRFIFAWPTARYAVMSGASAANTLVEIRIRTLERGGHKLSDEEKQEIRANIQATYDAQTDIRYAAARLWVDAIIDPAKTREAVLMALESASHNPVIERFHPGVLQT